LQGGQGPQTVFFGHPADKQGMKGSISIFPLACRVLLLVTLGLLPPGCASSGPRPARTASLDNPDFVVQALYQHYESWKGVRYREGGLSRAGIDCSGFVHRTFHDQFGVQLPRTTTQLVRVGGRVKGGRLKPGDLVFFRTGLKKRHVGIYVEDGLFVHASTSSGVVLSNLSNDYWKSRFWTARRLDI